MAARTTAEAEQVLAQKHELVEALEEDFDDDERALAKYREQRMRELQESFERTERMKAMHHGEYTEITVEKEFLKLTTTVPRVVAHFAHKQFQRCQIIDAHLKTLASKHFDTKFVKVDVQNVPFFVDKLHIKVLPCIISFHKGTIIDRLVGFEDLGNTDSFSTEVLEKRLLACGVIEKVVPVARPSQKAVYAQSGAINTLNDDDDLADLDGL